MKCLFYVFVLSFLANGCQKYNANPIDRQKLVNEVNLNREQYVLPDLPFTFDVLLEVVSQNNADLQLIRAQYLHQEKYAKTKTPLPNPNIGIGIKKGIGLEGATQSVTQPFVSLGFTVPLWGKRKLARELEFLEASATQQEYVILHRSIYLDLRQIYFGLRLRSYQMILLKDIILFLEAELKSSEKQLLQGQISLLDLGILKAEYEQSLSEKIALEQEISLDFSRLSGLSGISTKLLQKLELPKFEASTLDLPPREVAMQYLIENSPALNRLHSQYDYAEKSLALEIRKQYPDLQIESGFEKEPGESTRYLGLALGMEIPIFDRNQKGILLAHQKREQILLEYQLQARKDILEMEIALEMLKSTELQIQAIQKNQMKTYFNNFELAKRAYLNNQIEKGEMISARKEFFALNKECLKLLEAYAQYCVSLESTIGKVLFEKEHFKESDTLQIMISVEDKKIKENNNVKK